MGAGPKNWGRDGKLYPIGDGIHSSNALGFITGWRGVGIQKVGDNSSP